MRLLLISSSNVHGYGYLDHAEPEIRDFLAGVKRVSFVPFAIFDRDGYVAKIRERLGRIGIAVDQVRTLRDLETAESIFVGGGNTWRLLKTLQDMNALEVIRHRVRDGVPYMGSSAGTNIAGPTIKNTNDMPIVQPRSFEALGLVRYQLNPHYQDADPSSTHMGETREQRLLEYLEENEVPVLAIREGTMLRVDDDITAVRGSRNARIYRRGSAPEEIEPGTLLNWKLERLK